MSLTYSHALFFGLIVFASCGTPSTVDQESASNEPEWVMVKGSFMSCQTWGHTPANPDHEKNFCFDSVCIRYRVPTDAAIEDHLTRHPEQELWLDKPVKIEWEYSFWDDCENLQRYRTNPKCLISSSDGEKFAASTPLPILEADYMENLFECSYYVEIGTESMD